MMYSGKGKGSVNVRNKRVDGSDFLNDMIMGFSSVGPSRPLAGGSSSSSFIPFDSSVNRTLNFKNSGSGFSSSSALLSGYNEENPEGFFERSLSDRLYKMHIGDYDYVNDMKLLGSIESGVRFEDVWLNGTVGSNLNCNVGDFGGSESFSSPNSRYLFGRPTYNVDESSVGSFRSVSPYKNQVSKEQMDHLLEMSKGQKRGYHRGESEFQNPCVMNGPSFVESFFSPRYHGNDDVDDDDDGGGGDNALSRLQRLNRGFGLDYPCTMNRACADEGLGLYSSRYAGIDGCDVGDNNALSPVLSSQLMKPRIGWNSEYDCLSSLPNQWPRGLPKGMVNPSFLSMPSSRDCETVGFKQNFVPQEEALKCYANGNLDILNRQKMNEVLVSRLREKILATYYEEYQLGGFCEVDLKHFASNCEGSHGDSLGIPATSLMYMQLANNSLVNVQDYLCQTAKDQVGCRILQMAFDQGTPQDVQLIFDGIINRIGELMVDTFANYLVQKLLDFCNDEQRMQIVLSVTREPGQLVRIALDTHGTRVVQKLIETITTRQQISSVIRSLEPSFLAIATDLNGNHVLQRCLLSLSKEHNKFILNAAARYCFDIATHRYGCCVLNKCIGYASGKQRDKLLASIIFHALDLAQDAFGNYVIQYIIELKNHSTASALLSQFEGHFVQLSKQKFSSHVVEKCLKFIEVSRPKIICELVSVPQFEQLLQDPFANYVIQSALEVAKGSNRAMLINAVRPHLPLIRSNPFCKKLLSQNKLKKKSKLS